MKMYSRLVLCVCSLALLYGCATNQFAKPIGTFEKSVDASVGVIGSYYEDMNAYERRLYLESAYLNPKQRIAFTDSGGKPTAILGKTFSAESIKARLDALTLVSKYAKRLAELAGSEAPTSFSANTKVLGENLEKLAGTFGSLSNSDPTASQYIGPISTLVGLIGQIYLEQRRDAALEKAIKEGDPVVTKILELVQTDLTSVIDPARRTGEKQLLTELVTYYNDHRLKFSQAERRVTIDAINVAAERWSKAVVFNPAELVSGMADAHKALVKYARSSRKPADLAELSAAVELFADRVEITAGAIQKLQQVK